MAKMSDQYRDKFLAKTRYGHLTTLTSDGSPRTVPVWFDWDGQAVRVFTSRNSPKVKRIRQDPRVTLVVSNELSEYEAWVSFDGTAKITVDNAIEKFLDKLASKYWDLSDPDRKATLDSWKADPAQFFVLELVPTQIRTNVD